ncbi:isochorismatase family protein [Sinorhizobium meliloti]|uniref:cysteine hydrolase family protein n=1 Tax=Rhizobium meliloti TaxID=382 RepID=UPI000FD81408|nr:cysteine hydrolase family protein [Sinorhizobium meliloti]MDW9407327.1 isochorismatase family protein [Sinorhizobium meliloti]MDW9452801.1 isochorismatase family protein [Sinorhizobium meliloti]MDW9465438.1 isochorismatase family protein [Sinorhizobium meliloti]MDW9516767.1 isochorismatase family protein [Sinorhizobium meliloti]MDW9553663.1 isochorismatase family protein [Sinorhizobium meliloti]
MSKRAIIVVDLQNDYLATGKFPLVGIDTALENAARLVDAARRSGDLVVNIRHESPAGAPFFVSGTEGAEIIPNIAPQHGEAVVTKRYPNSFRETELASLLSSAGVDEVTVIGAMSHMCIDATARAASDLGYKTTVVEDACATRDLEFRGEVVAAAKVHVAYMSALAFGYGQVVSTRDYLAN